MSHIVVALVDLIGNDAFAMSFQSVRQYREALLNAAPAVQGEPVAVLYADGTVLAKAECGDSFAVWCKVQTPLYAAPQPAEQQLKPDVATQILNLISNECRYWHGRDEARRGGYAILYAKAKELISKQKPALDAAGLVEALDRIANLPMNSCSTENDYRLSAAKAIALAAVGDFRDDALAAHRKQQEGET